MEILPPSYVFDAGQGGRISCSYSIYINVTQKSRHAFWHNRNRCVRYPPTHPCVIQFPPPAPGFRIWKAVWRVFFLPFPSLKAFHLTWEFTCFFLNSVPYAFLFLGWASHVIPINYVPRSRPPHEFPRDLGFPRSAIKALPEAWSQVITAQGAISCNVRTALFSDFLPFSVAA